MKSLLKKQSHAVFYLRDDTTTELLYGGAAGGGKSALGVAWIIEQAQKFSGSRWLIGRSKRKALYETTLNTFFELVGRWNIAGQFNFNQQLGVITWINGSQIILKDLFLYPSDPEFDSLGSLEITGAFIDEVAQVSFKAWEVVKSRCRYKLTEFAPDGSKTADLPVVGYNIKTREPAVWRMKNGKITEGLIPKVLGTCNPTKNWIYKEFYLAAKNNSLKPYRKFIQALPTDNPYLSQSYLDSLLQMDKNSRERLYYGNWEYDDNPNALCDYEDILNIFTNEHVKQGVRRYITADVARLGSDKAVILVWAGWRVIKAISYDKSKINELAKAIKILSIKYNVPRSNIIADEDGVGGGLVDILSIKGFTNNARALNDENYKNLKTQCYYKLAKVISTNNLFIAAELSEDQKKEIIEEMEQIESYNIDSDGKAQIKPKEEIKRAIGRSPDWTDALAMRVYFEIQRKMQSVSIKAS